VNWSVPAGGRFSRIATHTDIRDPAVFVPITPCRIVDTRNPVGPYGGPAYASGETRTYDMDAGSCTGIPNAAAAFSVNLTIVNYNTSVGGFITAWQGGPRPFTSNVNYGTGPAVANAAVIPASNTGSISVFAFGSTHLIIDINGYYLDWLPDANANRHLSLWGTYPGGGMVQGQNYSTTPGIGTAGVTGIIINAAEDTAGVVGLAPAGAGNYGVWGMTDSTSADAAGVYGIAGAPLAHEILGVACGVRGDAANTFGIIGFTESTTHSGVAGSSINPADGVNRTTGYLGLPTYGVFSTGDTGATGTKNFVDPHPTDASRVIKYVSIEGREPATFFRGKAKFVNGHATIEVPEDFRMVTESDTLTVHLTTMGGFANTTVMNVSLEQIEVAATRDVDFSYWVVGVRKGYREYEPIVEGREFMPESGNSRLPVWLNEAQKRSLIQNGTYNEDGTVNLGTAVRLGWDKLWAASEK